MDYVVNITNNEIPTGLFQNIWNTQLNSLSWIFQAGLIFLIMLAITRDTQEWKKLAFPITLALYLFNVNVPYIILMGTAVAWVVGIAQTGLLTTPITIIKDTYKDLSKNIEDNI